MCKKRFLIILLLLVSQAILPQATNIPTLGLIGAWPFSGNANDAVGTNSATIVTASLTADRCGNPNSAYTFDGINDYIILGSAGPTSNTPRSVSFWGRTTQSNLMTAFAYGGSSGGLAYALQYNYNCAGIGIDVNNQAITRGNNCVLDGVWHHIVAVLDTNQGSAISDLIFYIDGVMLPAITCVISGSTQVLNTGTTFPISIGKIHDNIARLFKGDLDDFYLYNRALSSTEVLQLFNAQTCSVAGNTLICPGSTNTYSVPSIPNGVFTWILPSGWTGTSTTNVISATAGTAGGQITVAFSNTCLTYPVSSTSVQISTANSLSISISHPTICSGNYGTLIASGASSYTWSTGQNTPTIVVSPSVTTTYSVTGSGGLLCSATSAVTQTVIPVPTISVSGNPPVCNGDPVTLFASGAASYTWLPAALTGSVFSVSPISSQVYTVIGSDYSCTSVQTKTLNVPPALSVSVVNGASSACVGSTQTLAASSSGGTGSVSTSWNPSSASGSVLILFGSVAGNTTHIVIVTDNVGCTASDSMMVTFNQNPTITVSSHSICPNAITQATATGGVSYIWQPMNGIGSTQTLSSGSPQSYTVTGSTSQQCTASVSGSLFIFPAPTLSFSSFSITCASLGASTVTATGNAGPYTYSWIPTGQAGSIATNMFPGTHTVLVHDQSTGCVFNSTNYFAPLVHLTGSVNYTDSVKCWGDATAYASVTLSGGSGSQSYIWLSGNGTQTNSIGTGLSAGIHTVIVADSLTYCSLTQTFQVSEPPQLQINLSPSSQSVCSGDTIHINAGLNGGTGSYTYSWEPGPVSLTNKVWENVAGKYTYSFSAKDANNCAATQTISLHFLSYPQLSIIAPTLCPMQSGFLTATGANTYSWSNGSTSSITPVTLSSTSIFTLWGSNFGCISVVEPTVNIKPLPTPGMLSNSPVCVGDTLILQATAGYTYNWEGPNFSGTSVISKISPVNVSDSGVYELTVTAANSCTASSSLQVIIHPLPVAHTTGTAVCAGQNTMLWSAFYNNTSYHWKGPNAFSSFQHSFAIPNADSTSNGVYSVTVTNQATGCSTQSAVALSVTYPTPITFHQNGPLCTGDTLRLSADSTYGVLWQGSSIQSNHHTLTVSGFSQPEIFTLTVRQGPCKVDTAFNVYLHPPAGVTITPEGVFQLCENDSLFLSVKTKSAAVAYSWKMPLSNAISQNIQIPRLKVEDGGQYKVRITDINGCSAYDSIQVKISSAPNAHAIGDTVCIGSSARLVAFGGAHYQWNGPNGVTSQTNEFKIATTQHSASGKYTVWVSDLSGCTASASAWLKTLPFPLPVAEITQQPAKACINSRVVLTGAGGTSYNWSGPAGFNATGNQVSFIPRDTMSAGIYTLSVINPSNCSATTTLQLELFKQPKILLNPNRIIGCAPLCFDLEEEISVNSSLLRSPFFYVDGKPKEIQGSYFCVAATGIHTIDIQYIDTNLCESSTRITVTVFPQPDPGFYYTPLEPQTDLDPVRFISSGSCDSCEFSWYFPGSTHTSSVGESTRIFETSGTFPVFLMKTNKFGCTDTTFRLITLSQGYFLYMPDAFTPNGDGINDVFIGKGKDIDEFNLQIFDRWGELIFSSASITVGWDGTFRGVPCKDDIYTWRVSVDSRTIQYTKTGHVTLLR